MDIEHAPGYVGFVTASAGSKRARVPNEGEVKLNLSHNGTPLTSTFQVAEVTRPLMSVGRVCDQGLVCTFDDAKALITAKDGTEICRFERRGGLYVAKLDLKDPRMG